MTISRMLAKNWWMTALRGVVAILLGIALFISPGMVIATMVLFFGAYAFVDGIMMIITAMQNRGGKRWWLHLVGGIVGVIAGIVVFLYPSFALSATIYLGIYIVGVWALIAGFLKVMQAIEIRKEIEGEFWMAMLGFLEIMFGVLLIFAPAAIVPAVIPIVAIYAVVLGIILLVLAFRLRSHNSQTDTTSPSTKKQHA